MGQSGHQSFIKMLDTYWDQHRDPSTGKYIIAYSMDLAFDRREMQPILDAIKAVEDVSCIKFELLTQQKVPHKHSILFSKSKLLSKQLLNKSIGYLQTNIKSVHLGSEGTIWVDSRFIFIQLVYKNM